MKILNLYAGIGGNRKLWGNDHDITAVEIDESIATVYSDMYPDDTVIVGDAHEYLLWHYSEYEFIWSSPPCPTHSRARYGLGVHGHGYCYVYPDMKLYQEIILLKSIFKGEWVVENVMPYYDYLIEPTQKIGRHAYWSSFHINLMEESQNNLICGHTKPTNAIGKVRGELKRLQKIHDISLDKYTGIDKRKCLRNAVSPKSGLHILNCALNKPTFEQMELFKGKVK